MQVSSAYSSSLMHIRTSHNSRKRKLFPLIALWKLRQKQTHRRGQIPTQ